MMNSLTYGGLLFASMLGLMVFRVPIAAAMFFPAAIGYYLMTSEAALLAQWKQLTWARFSNYDLSVVPLFLLMGQFATKGGLSKALFQAARGFVGHYRGGLAMSSVIACAGFGAICGSAFATTATITQVALPEMRRYGYSDRLSTGTLAAAGTLGILIPPSVPLVIYAILTEQNVAKMFAAAMVPGIVATCFYLIVVAVVVRVRPGDGAALPRLGRGERLAMLRGVWPVVAIFLVVFGGIYGGIFTPTEGAAIGAVLTFTVALVKGELGWNEIAASFVGTATTTAMLFMIFLGADMMNVALAVSQVPLHVSEAVLASGLPSLVIVGGILVIYIILGCVMDEMAMILLTLPVLFPVIMGLDLHGLGPEAKAIWFGILILMVIEMGMIIPPVGLNVYIINSLAKTAPMAETYRGVIPFVVSDIIRTSLLLAFPAISLIGLKLVE